MPLLLPLTPLLWDNYLKNIKKIDELQNLLNACFEDIADVREIEESFFELYNENQCMGVAVLLDKVDELKKQRSEDNQNNLDTDTAITAIMENIYLHIVAPFFTSLSFSQEGLVKEIKKWIDRINGLNHSLNTKMSLLEGLWRYTINNQNLNSKHKAQAADTLIEGFISVTKETLKQKESVKKMNDFQNGHTIYSTTSENINKIADYLRDYLKPEFYQKINSDKQIDIFFVLSFINKVESFKAYVSEPVQIGNKKLSNKFVQCILPNVITPIPSWTLSDLDTMMNLLFSEELWDNDQTWVRQQQRELLENLIFLPEQSNLSCYMDRIQNSHELFIEAFFDATSQGQRRSKGNENNLGLWRLAISFMFIDSTKPNLPNNYIDYFKTLAKNNGVFYNYLQHLQDTYLKAKGTYVNILLASVQSAFSATAEPYQPTPAASNNSGRPTQFNLLHSLMRGPASSSPSADNSNSNISPPTPAIATLATEIDDSQKLGGIPNFNCIEEITTRQNQHELYNNTYSKGYS